MEITTHTLLLLLAVGLLALALQIRQNRKAFMTPSQLNLVSMVGAGAFLGMTLTAIKLLFS